MAGEVGGTGAGEGVALLVAGLADRDHARENLRLLARAFEQGWVSPFTVPAKTFANLPSQVAAMMDVAEADGDRRSIARGAEVIKGFAEYNLRLAEALDKSSRLDAGQATDRVEQTHTVTFDKAG